MRIISILGDITEHYRRGSLSEMTRLNIETALLQWINELPPALHLHDRPSRALTPYEFKSRQLHVPYFVTLIIFYRSETPGQHLSLASLVAASFVSAIFEEYVAWGDIMFLPAPFIFYLLVAALIQISSYHYVNLSANADSEIRTIRDSLKELKKRFPTAYGAERIFENLLQKSSSTTSPVQGFSMTLSPTQRELLAPFGPGLCHLWSTVFAEQDEGTEAVSTFGQVSTARRDRRQHPQNNVLETGRVLGLTGGAGLIDFTQNAQAELGQGINHMHVPRPDESLGEAAFGGLDTWWPDWTDLNFS